MPGSLFNKIRGAACNFIKNVTLAQVFSCGFCEILKTPFFIEHLRVTAFVSASPETSENLRFLHSGSMEREKSSPPELFCKKVDFLCILRNF